MADSTPEAAAANAAELLAAVMELEGGVGPSEVTAIDASDPEKVDPLAALPNYARGLLQIRVPVTVTLASQRKNVQEIVELGPGAIIKFDKTCDEPLALCVGTRPIATGEVVKVGDKFGLRIGRMA